MYILNENEIKRTEEQVQLAVIQIKMQNKRNINLSAKIFP